MLLSDAIQGDHHLDSFCSDPVGILGLEDGSVAQNDFLQLQSQLLSFLRGISMQLLDPMEMKGCLPSSVFDLHFPESMLAGGTHHPVQTSDSDLQVHCFAGFPHIAIRTIQVAGVGNVKPYREGHRGSNRTRWGEAGGQDQPLAGQRSIEIVMKRQRMEKILPSPMPGLIENTWTSWGIRAEGKDEPARERDAEGPLRDREGFISGDWRLMLPTSGWTSAIRPRFIQLRGMQS
jgi:hypothetical protein